MKNEMPRTIARPASFLPCLALAALISAAASIAQAEKPVDLAITYAMDAAREHPGYVATALRGRELFSRHFTASKDFSSCATCHTDNPAADGKHQMTGKRIAPMAPAANPERFSSPSKVEKWFKRNCNEVIGRECSTAEKADFITYMIAVRP